MKDGGPAFPGMSQRIEMVNGPVLTYLGGLSKRELFAAMAMQGMLANPSLKIGPDPSVIRDDAYTFADAMLEGDSEDE